MGDNRRPTMALSISFPVTGTQTSIPNLLQQEAQNIGKSDRLYESRSGCSFRSTETGSRSSSWFKSVESSDNKVSAALNGLVIIFYIIVSLLNIKIRDP